MAYVDIPRLKVNDLTVYSIKGVFDPVQVSKFEQAALQDELKVSLYFFFLKNDHVMVKFNRARSFHSTIEPVY